ncbi:MAG: hypothetical protein AAGH79_14050 [Bacteroidota bacterium]
MRLITAILLGALPFCGLAQQLMEINPDACCSYYGEDIAENQIYSFSSSTEAEEIVQRIVDVVGLKPNFEIKAGNVPNALATIQNGQRLILYSQNFMLKINNSTGTNWAGISILAHEIAHHLQGHTIEGGGSRPELELEADEWSGFALAKMGATLEEAQKAVETHSSHSGSRTHPPKSARLEAIAVGWAKGNKGILSSATNQPINNINNSSLGNQNNRQEITQPVSPANRLETSTIHIAYAGDSFGCALPVSINIGGKAFELKGNFFTTSGIPRGKQAYQITGEIDCGAYGACTAYGEGFVIVEERTTYYLVWQNTGFGQCSIWLQPY